MLNGICIYREYSSSVVKFILNFLHFLLSFARYALSQLLIFVALLFFNLQYVLNCCSFAISFLVPVGICLLSPTGRKCNDGVIRVYEFALI